MTLRSTLRLLNNPANRGRHLILVAGKVFRAKDGRQALRILKYVHETFPKKKVTLTYIPKSDSLILPSS